MPAQGRLGDKARAPLDAHGCPACPHPTVGPAVRGSSDVHVNSRPAVRVDDGGIHAACCGTNQWQATQGSASVFINGKAAHRVGDEEKHCGGSGFLIEGSPNVMVGGPPSGGSGLTGSAAGKGGDAGGAADRAGVAGGAAATRAAMRDAARSGRGLVKRDCKHCEDDASVSAIVDPEAVKANEEDDRAGF